MNALCKVLDYIHKGRKLQNATFKTSNTLLGSPFWMAAEVIEQSEYNEEADIWALAIADTELAQGLPPYAKQHPYRSSLLIPGLLPTSPPPRLEGLTCQNLSGTSLHFVPRRRIQSEQVQSSC